MDISGPVRNLLRRMATPWDAGQLASPLFFIIRVTALEDHPPTELPAFLADSAPPLLRSGQPWRPAEPLLALAGLMRVLPRVQRSFRREMETALRMQVQPLQDQGQHLLASRSATPADLLWHYWVRVLAQKRGLLTVPDMLLKVLWKRAWAGQSAEGFLHPRGPQIALETSAYQDFTALHAACNAIVLTQDYDLFPPVQRLTDAHVAATQPDHITQEPWALAAFAALDDSQTFAAQQLHDATEALGRIASPATSPIAALLADAALTQEETAAGLG